MSDWTLRRATAIDAQFLFRVYASTRLEELAPTGWSEVQIDAFLRMQFDAQDRHYHLHFPQAECSVVQSWGADYGIYKRMHWRPARWGAPNPDRCAETAVTAT